MQIKEFVRDEQFSPALIAKALRTTQAEIADTLGLPRDALSRKTRVGAPRTQNRLRQMVEILRRVSEHSGSTLYAYAWYRSEPLVGFRRHDACSNSSAKATPTGCMPTSIGSWLVDTTKRGAGAVSRTGVPRPRSKVVLASRVRRGGTSSTAVASTGSAWQPCTHPCSRELPCGRRVSLECRCNPCLCVPTRWTRRRSSTRSIHLNAPHSGLPARISVAPTGSATCVKGAFPHRRSWPTGLISAGYAGMIAPAYYRGAGPEERNLILWKWGGRTAPPRSVG